MDYHTGRDKRLVNNGAAVHLSPVRVAGSANCIGVMFISQDYK